MSDEPIPDEDAGEFDSTEEVAHCPQCATPFEPTQYYCSKCGWAVGKVTTCVPYVYIPAMVAMSASMWRKTWRDPGTSFPNRVFYLLLIALLSPIMFVGMPFILREKWRRQSNP